MRSDLRLYPFRKAFLKPFRKPEPRSTRFTEKFLGLRNDSKTVVLTRSALMFLVRLLVDMWGDFSFWNNLHSLRNGVD